MFFKSFPPIASPPHSSFEPDKSTWALQTPRNPHQLQHQATAAKQLIDGFQRLSLSPINRALNRIAKAAEITMTEVAIAKKELRELRAANEKEKKKRQRSTKRIQNGGGLTRDEVQDLQNQAVEAVANDAGQSTHLPSQLRVRAPPTCSNCHTVGHTRVKCPNPITI